MQDHSPLSPEERRKQLASLSAAYGRDVAVKLQHRIDPWDFAGRVLRSVEALVPGAITRIAPTKYPMCRKAWELEVEHHGRSLESLAWGIYTDAIVRYLGADPARHMAIGLGYGLERLAAIRYDIDDIRRVELAKVG